MQTAVTVVNLIHDTATETDRPVCWVFPGCSWRECRSTSGSGTAKDPERTTHIRIPASVCTMGYLPYAQWAALPAAEKAKHWTLKRGWKLVQGFSESRPCRFAVSSPSSHAASAWPHSWKGMATSATSARMR